MAEPFPEKEIDGAYELPGRPYQIPIEQYNEKNHRHP